MNRTEKSEKDVKDFLFVGAPLLDLSLQCTSDMLKEYGLKSDDCIRETKKQEALLQSLLHESNIQKSAGGSSQNSARIAKWVLGDRGRVAFAGCVGKDECAETLAECLWSEGVEPLYISLPDESTGFCACLLSPDGDRSMISHLGAAAHLAQTDLQKKNIHDRIGQVQCIFVEGYVFGHSPDVILTLAKTCSDSQVFSISVSAEYVCRDYADTLALVLPRIDVLFSNEAEAKVLAQSLQLGDISSVEDIARILASRFRSPNSKPRIVVITRGPNPVLVVRGNDPVLTFPVPSDIKVVDGIGCGDAMAGAFLAVYVLTGDVCLAAKTGISASVEILQVSGCTPTQKILYLLDDL